MNNKFIALKSFFFSLGLLSAVPTGAASPGDEAPKAGFFRVWRGYRKQGLNDAGFLAQLAPFMRKTTDLYGPELLSNYLVALPPEERPALVPAEFALIALENEEGYRAIRATPEGQAYADAHWEIFDRETSKSANLKVGLPDVLETGSAYDLSPEALDWRTGENLFYLGTRKEGLSQADFLSRLRTHMELVQRELQPLGLRGYIVLADEGYEAAFLNWESEEARLAAFAGQAGPKVMRDAAEFMDGLQYSTALKQATGEAVEAQTYLSTMGQGN
jgi:hypothetical protein